MLLGRIDSSSIPLLTTAANTIQRVTNWVFTRYSKRPANIKQAW